MSKTTNHAQVENYLQYSDYEYEEYSSSGDSSHVHSEQVGPRTGGNMGVL